MSVVCERLISEREREREGLIMTETDTHCGFTHSWQQAICNGA